MEKRFHCRKLGQKTVFHLLLNKSRLLRAVLRFFVLKYSDIIQRFIHLLSQHFLCDRVKILKSVTALVRSPHGLVWTYVLPPRTFCSDSAGPHHPVLFPTIRWRLKLSTELKLFVSAGGFSLLCMKVLFRCWYRIGFHVLTNTLHLFDRKWYNMHFRSTEYMLWV